MKNKITPFLAGVFITICLASTKQVQSIFEVKPARPKKTKTAVFYDCRSMGLFIDKNLGYGYQVNTITASSSVWIVVLYKY